MSKKFEKSYQHEPPYVRSNSRNSRDTPPVKGGIRTYKDFITYSNQVENSSSHSDIPSKGVKRSSKITSLQQQFEDLKKKIREVQNKNQKIIEKISFSKDVKKRRSDEYYNHNAQQISQDNPSYSDIVTPHTKNKWPAVPLPQKNKMNLLSFYQSDKEPKSQMELQTKELYPTRKINQSADLGKANDDTRQKNRLKVDMIALEDRYFKQQSKLQHLKNNFKNYSDCVKLIFQNQLGQFMDNISSVLTIIQNKNNRNKDKVNRLQSRVIISKSSRKRDIKLSSSFDLGSKRKQKSQIGASDSSKIKNKEFQSLIGKYEQLLRTKNDQIEKLTNQIKSKQREIMQMGYKYDQIKEEKRRMGHEHDEMVAKLQGKIQALMQAKPVQKKKQFINLAASRQKDRQKSRQKQRQKQKKDESSQKHLKQIRILQSKLSFTQTRLQQKLKAIQQLQNEIRSNNDNKMKLISQYQQTLENTRASHKNKLEDVSNVIQDLKSSLKLKDQTLLQQTSIFKDLQHKCIQLQIQLNTLNQKLLLKQDIQSIQRSAVKRANQFQQNNPIDNISFSNENSNIFRVESLERQKRQLQYKYDKLKGEFQIYKLSSRSTSVIDQSLKQKDIIIKDLKLKLQKSTNSSDSPLFKRKQTNLLESNLMDESTYQQFKSKIKFQDEQIVRLKNMNQQLRRQNISVSSKVIGLGHDVNLNEQLHKQQQQKTKQLKLYIDQLQKTVAQLQKLLDNKNKQLNVQKQNYQKQLLSIENGLKTMQEQIAFTNVQLIQQTDKVNIKVLEVKKLQQQNQDLKLNIFQLNEQKQRIQLKLQDIQKDVKKQQIVWQKSNQQNKQNILKLKKQLQKLENDNITLIEINKHQKSKIQELELENFNDNQSKDDCMSSVSDIKTENMAFKLKNLQSINLENDINKANLQRHLKNAQETNLKLMDEVKQLVGEVDKKKQQYNSAVISYDQRIHQLQENLESAQKALKQQQLQQQQRGSIDYRDQSQTHMMSSVQNQRVYKSQIRSQSSLMFSNTSQLYGDREIDFKLSDDGGSDAGGEINVEVIFNNLNYPYENIKLRRKDQMQFIKSTAQLINKLKSTINQKNRKIKSLQRKVAPEKNNDFLPNFTESVKSDDFEDIQDFNENYSVRFDDKRYDKNRKLKQLQNQTHLVMQQNNLLLQQVTNLQDQIQKAQQQQNNLVRLKEVLKQQVKKLQKTLDQKNLDHQEAIKKLQKVIQQNEAMHNSETLRILLPKIFSIIGNEDFMRKQEKRKQLEEYIKIVATLLRIQFVPLRYSGRR